MGRPRIYDSVDDLETMCNEYFDVTNKPCVSGLALYLGFADKSTLYEYRDREEFSYPIKKALTRIELYHESRLSENSVTGSIFALKNMGWKDKVETEHSGEIAVKQITGMQIK
jgi:hypothetical protein